jgi:hypothetical protein
MFEKILLTVTITFSLNFFFQVRVPEHTNFGNYQQHSEKTSTILVTNSKK